MNWLTSTFQNLHPKRSIRLLTAFSLLALSGAGVVWACADFSYDDVSSFAPEYFVDKKYSPFFYDSYSSYYVKADTNYLTDNVTRFAKSVEEEWINYLGQQLTPQQVSFLLFKASPHQIDSLGATVSDRLNEQGKNFFNYLPIAKDCETYSLNDVGWYEKVERKAVPEGIEGRINHALATHKDPFIRQRLWFQLVRYQFFSDTTGVKTAPAFYKFEKEFPRNLMYYRTLGYLAGAEYAQQKYALANYHYSLCYDYTWKMALPSQWSFHPQEETDWKETLKLAKSAEEKVTLWHLMGIQYDQRRALQEIVKLNPRSDKMDLLLSRMINIIENGQGAENQAQLNQELTDNIHVVDAIAMRSDLVKPLYWRLAAGYLHYLKKDYNGASIWYQKAKLVLPEADLGLQAQYKLLKILLDVQQLKKIDLQTEQKLVEPLNWLADLRDEKRMVPYLRYNDALITVTAAIGKVYKQQRNLVKANCFIPVKRFYLDSIRMDSTEKLLLKPSKTRFENAMLRYYNVTAPELFYHQALLAVYKEQMRSAIGFMERADTLKDIPLPADPFYSRLIDCHDCEFEQKRSFYTPINFLKKIVALKANLKAGKQKYQSALMLGGAYYNLTHYGNSRQFFQTDITGSYSYSTDEYPAEYLHMFTSQYLAEKYYRLALNNAVTPEQKARATFLLSKCERNSYYNKFVKPGDYAENMPPAGNWFAQLKSKYANTAYYKEVLKECGYFRSYVNGR
jgi:hypothetical protein